MLIKHNNKMRFTFTLFAVFLSMFLLFSCHKRPQLYCEEGWVLIRDKPAASYQDYEVTWDGRIIVESTNPHFEAEDCDETNPAIQGTDTLTFTSPQDLIQFEKKTLHIGIWDHTMSIKGDDCPYVIKCEHEVFWGGGPEGGQPIEFSTSGCVTPIGGLRNHLIFADFTSHPNNQPPCSWSEKLNIDSSDWLVVDGELRGNQTSTGRRLLTWDIASNEADIEILTKVLTHTKSQHLNAQVHLRASGALGNVESYLFGLTMIGGNEHLQLRKFTGASATPIASSPFSYEINNWYWLRLRAQGDRLQARIWAEGIAEPQAWMIDATDSQIIHGGWVGIGSYDQDDDPHFGWFSLALGGHSAGLPQD